MATNDVGNSVPSIGAGTTSTSASVTSGASGTIALSGAVNGTNTAFTLATALPASSIPSLTIGSTYLTFGTDYTISGTTLTFAVAPASGSVLALTYYFISLAALSYF